MKTRSVLLSCISFIVRVFKLFMEVLMLFFVHPCLLRFGADAF